MATGLVGLDTVGLNRFHGKAARAPVTVIYSAHKGPFMRGRALSLATPNHNFRAELSKSLPAHERTTRQHR